MSKTATETPGVFKISMKNGQTRLWCSECKKFLSNSGGGFHTCDPNWRARLQQGKTSGGKSKRWRLTPARKNRLIKLIVSAVKYDAIVNDLKKLSLKLPKWRGLKKLASGKIDKKKSSILRALRLL